MDRIAAFMKSAAIWATVLTVLLMGINLYGQWQDGKPILETTTFVATAVLWVLAFGFVLFVKVVAAARRFGSSLGSQIVKTPHKSAGEAARHALDHAVGPRRRDQSGS